MNSIKEWRRMIALVDMDAFFAAIEQQDNPRLRGMPVGVVNGEKGSTLVAASYEARRFGIRTGTTWAEAQQRCSQCVRIVARPARYAEVSHKIMQALVDITPDIEVFSIDEAFLDLTSCQAYYRFDPESIAKLIQQKVREASGVSCSVGVSGDRTTAKWAAGLHKPGGYEVVHPDEAENRLAPLPLTVLCGIGPGIANFFSDFGITTCGDMKKIPISVPATRFGNLGRRFWLMAQGKDPAPVISHKLVVPQSISHAKVLPPGTNNAVMLQSYYFHLAEKMAARLRQSDMVVRHFHIGLRAPEGWRQAWFQSEQPTNDGLTIFRLCKKFLKQHWFGEGIQQIHLYGKAPSPAESQADLFAVSNNAQRDCNAVMDKINAEFGAFTLHRGLLPNSSTLNSVISPSYAKQGMASGFLEQTQKQNRPVTKYL